MSYPRGLARWGGAWFPYWEGVAVYAFFGLAWALLWFGLWTLFAMGASFGRWQQRVNKS